MSRNKHEWKCCLSFHGAGPTPRATWLTPLPVADGTKWVPVCDECLSALAKDAARDGLPVLRTRIITKQAARVEDAEVVQ